MQLCHLAVPVLAAFLVSGCTNYQVESRQALSTSDLAESRDATQQDTYKILGAVYHPGTFHLPPGKTLYLPDAIAQAGGTVEVDTADGAPYDIPSLGGIRVLRIEDGQLVVLRVGINRGDVGRRFRVRPGDRIYVPTAYF